MSKTTLRPAIHRRIPQITGDVALKPGSVVAYELITNCHIDKDPSGKMKMKYAEEFINANGPTNGFAPFIGAKTGSARK